MRPPEEVKLEFLRGWWRKAEADRRMALHLLEGGEGFFEGVAFHCQQAVEKYLKALLVWHQIEFPKTHDLHVLLELTGSVDEELPGLLIDASELTPFGVEYRYPGTYPATSLADIEEAIRLVELVRTEISSRLPSLP